MADHKEAPEIIMFVRHGEEPGEGSRPHGVDHHGEIDEHSLSVKGWTPSRCARRSIHPCSFQVPSPYRAAGPNIRNPADPRSEKQTGDEHRDSDSPPPEARHRGLSHPRQ